MVLSMTLNCSLSFTQLNQMTNNQINQEYTEDQLFILQDIADEQRAAMEDGWDEDGAQDYLSDIAVSLMEQDHD
jgi:hypothetical protein